MYLNLADSVQISIIIFLFPLCIGLLLKIIMKYIFIVFSSAFFHWYFWGFFFKNQTLAWRLECSPMARETCVQSQVESYQRLKKWYLMSPCLTLSIIRYGSRVKGSNPEKWVAHPLHLCVVAIEKGAFGSPSTKGRQLYFTYYFWVE